VGRTENVSKYVKNVSRKTFRNKIASETYAQTGGLY
jgi:hypothetical protein